MMDPTTAVHLLYTSLLFNYIQFLAITIDSYYINNMALFE
jgi:hypothetical protein